MVTDIALLLGLQPDAMMRSAGTKPAAGST